MARYIENLNTCSDPTTGDYLWIYDASAGSTDKDRKVDAGLFAQKAVANTFTTLQTFAPGAGQAVAVSSVPGQVGIQLNPIAGGTGPGAMIQISANTDASTPAPGTLIIQKVNGLANCYLWFDDAANLRTLTNANITSVNRNSGTVVGTQTSSLDSKDVLEGVTGIEDVLAAVRAGAEAVRRFTYKSGAFNGEEFEGVVVDYAPRYGMDRDAEHEAGKSLNLICAVGDLLRAVAWLVEREKARA